MPQEDADNGVDVLYGMFQDAKKAALLLIEQCDLVTRKTIVDSAIEGRDVLGGELFGYTVQTTSRMLEDIEMRLLLTSLMAHNWTYVPGEEANLPDIPRDKLDKLDMEPKPPFSI